jgi:hypothetical protein
LITTADEASAVEERTVAILESIDPLGGDDLLTLLRREVLHQNARAKDAAVWHGFELQLFSGAPVRSVRAAHGLSVREWLLLQ